MSVAEHIPGRFTYRQLKEWPDDERWELIDGVPYCMSPAPGTPHQDLVYDLREIFKRALGEGDCRAYGAPTDVFPLVGGDDVDDQDTCVQPDVMIVCGRDKITRRGIVGPPALVVEVLSASTATKDNRTKRDLYARAGVGEYWVVDIDAREIDAYTAPAGGAWGAMRTARDGDVLTPAQFPSIRVDIKALFDQVFIPEK